MNMEDETKKMIIDINMNNHHQQEASGATEDEEQQHVKMIRAIVQAKDSSAEDLDDVTLRRFLRARDMDIGKASTLLLNYLSWRRSFPILPIPPSEIPNELSDRKVYLQGHDKQGHPLGVVFGAKHKPRRGGSDEFKRFVVYTLDKMCSRIPVGLEKFVAIIDLQGWGYANADLRGYIAIVSILQDYYPERLGRLFMIHVSRLFMTAWKVIYPFIDQKTREKIIFVGDKKLLSTLLVDIDESQLPEIYGGKLHQLVPIQDS